MALIIEDGTGVANADSYASIAEARAYASARGITLSAVDADVEILLRRGADFIDSLEPQFKGDRVESDQALAWPRENVIVFADTEPLPSTEIPALLLKAQCQLAVDAVSVDLQPTGTGRETIREKVEGAVEVEYAERGSGTLSPEPNKALAILGPLLQNEGGFSLTTIRV